MLLHPVTLVMLGLWLINDHVLKRGYPGLLSGKLSDVASLVVFPLLVIAAIELMRPQLSQRARRAVVTSAIVATGAAMIAIKLFDPAAWLYREGLGLLQWPFFAVAGWLRHGVVPGPRAVHLAMDATDLFTLPSLLIAAWISRDVSGDTRSVTSRSSA